MEQAENSNQNSGQNLSTRLRRLYSTIESCLLEFGTLEPRQSAIMALAKEVKADKAQMRDLVKLARENHPEINAIARVHKLVENAKASGKKLDVSMFRRLQPAAKSAGKDDIWLGEQLGYTPQFIKDANQTKGADEGKSRILPIVLIAFVLLAIVGGFVWKTTYGDLLSEEKIIAELDNSSWDEAIDLNTVDAYKSYLRNHSGGLYAELAAENINQLDVAGWEKATSENVRSAYEEYLAYFTVHANEALERLDTILPKDIFRDCVGCPDMIAVPAGSYQMGSDFGAADELPIHEVSIDKSFAVGIFELSFAEWDACVLRGSCSDSVFDNGWGRNQRPVINVTWDQAQTYVGWLSSETGESYRLLTESEWEYVARADSNGEYWWGDFFQVDMAVCEGCLNDWANESTKEVGAYRANSFGLYDIAGNVSEWVQDCWHSDYESAPSNADVWLAESAGDCAKAPIRGGSWLSNTEYMRAAKRAQFDRNSASMSIGFRVARDI